MAWTPPEIKYAFGGRLVGSLSTKSLVINTLFKFPPEIIDYVTKNCWILSSHPEAWAYTFTGDDLKGKHLIFLSDELLNEGQSQIQFTLAHEIGHVILGHKNSINFRQTKEEVNKQEFEADQFANKYLNN
jgi:Zn-dependent protease with chaperone function